MTVWRKAEQKLHAAHVSLCSAEAAFEWLRSQAPTYTDGTDYSRDAESSLSEYVLFRRGGPLIDLGLARYARNQSIVRRVHQRGGSAVRLAAWSNVAGGTGYSASGIWAQKSDMACLARSGTLSEIKAFSGNPSISEGSIEDIVKRKDAFSGLTEGRWIKGLQGLSENPRMAEEYGPE